MSKLVPGLLAGIFVALLTCTFYLSKAESDLRAVKLLSALTLKASLGDARSS